MEKSKNFIDFKCPFCRTGLRVDKNKGGLKGRCPECGKRIDIPEKGNKKD